jgi:acid phosphatase type 7
MRLRELVCASAVLLCTGCDEGEGALAAQRFGAIADVPAPRARYDADMEVCGGDVAYTPDMGVARAPYLQKVTPESAELLWTSSAQRGHFVDVTTSDGELVASARSRIERRGARDIGPAQHLTSLRKLKPGTLYCYALRPSGPGERPRVGFRTAPAPGAGARVTFVAFGDAGDGETDQHEVFESMQGVQFDLAIVTGDLAYPSGSLASLENYFFAVYAPILARIPVFPVAGNHDYETQEAAPFREVFSLPENGAPDGRERWYSFDWGDVHFVALDTERVGPEQAAWLHRDLRANTLPWVIAYAHKGPYASGRMGSNARFRSMFSPILAAYGVSLVLTGHDHDYERSRPIDGVTYVVTGGGGRDTEPVGTSEFTAFSLAVLHFVYVIIEGDDLRLYAIDGTGQEFDFVRITRP